VHERDFRQLYEDHYAHVLNYLRRDLPEESARDVTAETFLTAWRKLSEPPDHPVAWLLTVARHLRANAHRAKVRDLHLTDALARNAPRSPRFSPTTRDRRPTDDPSGDVPSGVAEHVSTHGVSAALGQLSPADRDVLLLVATDDLDNRGLAQVLKCTTGAARVRLHRARRRLLRLLNHPESAEPADIATSKRNVRSSPPRPIDPVSPSSSSTTEAPHGA